MIVWKYFSGKNIGEALLLIVWKHLCGKEAINALLITVWKHSRGRGGGVEMVGQHS